MPGILMSRTREKALTPTTRRQNAAMFGGDPERVPKRALTMGVGTILDARELILLATGAAKAGILAKAVEGPITAMVSASAIQLHPNCKVIVARNVRTYDVVVAFLGNMVAVGVMWGCLLSLTLLPALLSYFKSAGAPLMIASYNFV